MDRECSSNVFEIYKIYFLKAISAIKVHSDYRDKNTSIQIRKWLQMELFLMD